MASVLLIGDIGGTNARFALAGSKRPGFSKELVFRCADYASADAAIRQYLKEVGVGKPDVICLAAAGPIVEQRVRFTNNPWRIAAAELVDLFDISKVRLLNDFEAIAYSVPFLEKEARALSRYAAGMRKRFTRYDKENLISAMSRPR